MNLEFLLLHRGSALFLDEILEADEEHCLARLTVKHDRADSVPAWYGIEWMAQAASAYSGERKRLQGLAPRLGFLLGTQKYESLRPSFEVGTAVEVEARLHYLDDTGLSAFRCEVRQNGQTVARAMLKTFEPL
ncbi:MAG: 3-hydroxylacyl-ACP dehydratase [Firmicutes bacterium]|nr:3-hydroxylacyl-ACP dehydratase [Bacillota bacterium]